MSDKTFQNLPSYDQLPIDSKYPPHSAWGVWGEDDNLGTINMLTEERVANASKCIKRGAVFSINWKLESPSPALFGRAQIEHDIKPLIAGNYAFDDTLNNFNTQSSSQWDGLRHVAHLGAGKFYNGIDPTEIAKGNPETNNRLGMHHLARRGMAGRAVLLDYGRWALKHNPEFDPFNRQHEITVEELDKVAEAQGVTFQPADILLVRIGWMEKYERLGDKVKDHIDSMTEPSCAGVKACPETFKWIWDHHFSAVGSDNFPFEAYPPTDWAKSCHCAFLGGFGMPIGELLNLEGVAEDSAKDGVYEYFFTSAPLNKEGGVASPPNALCIK